MSGELYIYNLFILRNILASLHSNENIKREAIKRKDGEICYKVTWPKFKGGEEVARKVAVPQTYGNLYVVDIY